MKPSLIFNIIKPSYQLKYNVAAVNKMTIPTSFTDEKYIHAFLTDSLPFEKSEDKASAGASASLVVVCSCEAAIRLLANISAAPDTDEFVIDNCSLIGVIPLWIPRLGQHILVVLLRLG